jgi:hypothetical protein
MRNFLRLAASVSLLSVASVLPAQSLLTSPFAGTQATDFEGACGSDVFCFTAGPDQVGFNGFDVTFTGSYDVTLYGKSGYGLDQNGVWDQPSAGTNGETWVRLTFANPVTSVGAFMNYALRNSGEPDGSNPMLRAYDATNNLIASYDLFALAPIVTPRETNGGAFRGIEFAGGITTLELQGGYLITGDLIATSAVSVVPEPSTYALMGMGLLVVGMVRRRTRSA